jgi:uncharacterized protein YdeI (YjbR/CyaY-like superfamily)
VAQSDRKRVYAKSRADWRAWLKSNHKQNEAIWLIQHKKISKKPCVTYDEAVEEALCFGWIDSLVNKLDDERYLMMMSPRRPKSGWSKSNKDRVKKLIKAKKMTAAGLAKIEAAKKDGSWSKLDSP